MLYTTLMTVFGVQALKRWGLDRKDKFQIWRYVSLISFQWVFFFLVPEFLFQSAVKYQWVGAKLASDPTFAEQAWRSYGIVYAWPLFFYTFFYNPHQIWVGVGHTAHLCRLSPFSCCSTGSVTVPGFAVVEAWLKLLVTAGAIWPRRGKRQFTGSG